MDTGDLRSLHEAWNAVQYGQQYGDYDYDSSYYYDSEPQTIHISLSEHSIDMCFERAMRNVFCDGDMSDLYEYDTKETRDGTKFKIRVKDRSTGSSYIRYATRQKIRELRSNPNVASVELTNHSASAGGRDGTDASRQNFSGGANSNNSKYMAKKSVHERRAEKERRLHKKAFGF